MKEKNTHKRDLALIPFQKVSLNQSAYTGFISYEHKRKRLLSFTGAHTHAQTPTHIHREKKKTVPHVSRGGDIRNTLRYDYIQIIRITF